VTRLRSRHKAVRRIATFFPLVADDMTVAQHDLPQLKQRPGCLGGS
jgi:hypothetical protein